MEDMMQLPAIMNPSLVFSPHPILASAGQRLVYTHFEPGESLDHYLHRVGIHLNNQPVILHVNDMPVRRDAWATVYPMPGDLITVRAAVQGGGDGGSDPVKVILTIAVLIVAPELATYVLGEELAATAIIGSITYGSALAAVFVVGGSLIINSLFPPPSPNLSSAQQRLSNPSPTYALAGGSNRARPYEPLPLVLGSHKIYPDLGAREYTEFQGEDQFLYMVFNFGLSDIRLSDYKIGDTPLANYSDITTEEAGADGKVTIFPANVDSIAGGELTEAVGWVQRTSSINATALAIDIQGNLYRAGNTAIESLSVTIAMEYRKVGDSTWLPFWQGVSNLMLTNNNRKPLRKTYKIDVVKAQYEVRVMRVSPDETDARNVSAMTWSTLRTYQPDEADYTGQKRVALIARATGQLQGRLATFNAVAHATVPTWNGSAWSDQETDNPAWLFLWLARGKFNASGQRLFGAGLPDDEIDIEAIKDWGAWCTSKGLRCNVVFDRPMSAAEMLTVIARCGRGAPSWASGKYGVIWDEADQPIVGVFGMGNIRRDSFSVEYVTEKLADEVVCAFINPSLGWQQDTVRAKVPGVTNPVNPVTIELFGVTDIAQAGKQANLLAAEQVYRRRRVSWETDIEGLVVNRGNVVALSHDLTQWGQSGRIVSGSNTQLTLDRKVTFTPSSSHYVMLTFPDGDYWIYPVTYSTDTDTIDLDEQIKKDAWTASTSVTAGDLIEPTAWNRHYYEAQNTGTTGGAEPSFPTGSGATVLDNDVTWKEKGTAPQYHPGNDPDHLAMDYKYSFDPKATPGKKVKLLQIKPLNENQVRIVATDEDADYYLEEFNAYTYVTPSTYGGELPTITTVDVSETLISVGEGYGVRLTLTWDVTGEYGGAIIRTGLDGAALEEQGRTLGRRYEITIPDTGTIDYEITAFNLAGAWSDVGQYTAQHIILGKDADPADCTGFRVAQNGEVVVFQWNRHPEPDIAGFEIRYGSFGSVWADGTPLTEVTEGTQITTAAVPPGQHRFFLKAIDTNQNYSVNAVTAQLEVTTVLDALFEEEHAPDWPGTLTNLVKHWTGVLVPQSQNLASDDGWETFDQFVPNPYEQCVYEDTEHDIDFDDNVRVWANVVSALGPGETVGMADPLFEIDYRTEAGAYDGFERWGIGIVFARYVKYRVVIDTTIGVAKLTGLTSTLDIEPHTDIQSDVNISAAGTPITFVKPFHIKPAPKVIPTGAVALIGMPDNVTKTGFTARLFDINGNAVAGVATTEATTI